MKIADKLIDERNITIDIDFPALLSYKKEMLKNTKEEIDTIFGIGVDVVEKLFSEFTIEDIEDGDDFKQRIISASIVNKAKVQGIGVALSKKENEAKITLTITDESIPSDAIQGFRLLLNSFIFYTLAVYPISGVDVFPVERNSIYTFSKELSIRKQEAMDNLQLLVDKEKKISKFDIFFNSKRYPLPVKDGLMVAEDLAEVKKTKSEFYEFAEDLEVGKIYSGKVVRIMQFGAFVEIAPGKDGMIHISKLSTKRVEKVEDVVNIGDEVEVEVIKIDNKGRVDLKLVGKE